MVPLTKDQIVHYAPTQKAMRQVQPMCGYIGPADDISMDPRRCTCVECRTWITPPSQDQGITSKHGLPHGHPCSQCGAEAIEARASKEQVERFEIWSVSHDGMAELARQRAGMGPTDFEQYIPKCDRDVFVRWEDYDRLADEIKRLDADACNERAEKESWRAIAETRTRELAEARNASVPGSATVFAAVEAERDRLRAIAERLQGRLDWLEKGIRPSSPSETSERRMRLRITPRSREVYEALVKFQRIGEFADIELVPPPGESNP